MSKVWKKKFRFSEKKFGSDTDTDTFGRYRNRYQISVSHYLIKGGSILGRYFQFGPMYIQKKCSKSLSNIRQVFVLFWQISDKGFFCILILKIEPNLR